MSMTGRDFIHALRCVATEEFTDAIKECKQNPHEFSSEFVLRMDSLLRRERRWSWRIINSITSNVAAALLVFALLLTNVLAFPAGEITSSDFEGVFEDVYESAQIIDTAHALIVNQKVNSIYKEDRVSSLKNVVYVNDDDRFMREFPYRECPCMDDECDECIYFCNSEPNLCIEYSD